MRGKCQFWLHLTLILSLIIVTTTLFGPIAANPQTILYVWPDKTIETGMGPGTPFDIYIAIQDIWDLYGYEFKLKYNTTVLTATAITLGSFFPSEPPPQEWKKEINEPAGYVFYAVSLPQQSPEGVGGSGTLAIISFTVDSYGESLLEFDRDPNIDILGNSPPNGGVNIPHELGDGYFANVIVTHDIAVTSITASPTSVPVGNFVSIDVIVENQGDVTETPDVFVYYGSTRIDSANATLSPGAKKTIPFTWDTIDVTPGVFTIWAEARSFWAIVETDKDDNTKIDGQVTVYPRNIAITNVIAFPTAVNKTEPVFINVTVKNEGHFAETFNVTTYYDNTSIKIQTDVTLESQTNKTLTFTWNTTYVYPQNYTISAKASVIRGENNTDDNTYKDGKITVTTPPGFPTASFVISPNPPYFVGNTLKFNSTSTDPDGYIVSWKWDFNGDSVIDATDENATWTYTAVGTYTVTLTVTDNASLTDPIAKSIDIVKQSSTISITASPTYITAGESTTISGSITPKREKVTVTIWYMLIGKTWNILETVTTNDDSQYSYNWMIENAGQYEVKASWEGDANTEPAESGIRLITVNKMLSTISITANPTSVTVGSSITISGVISPVRAQVTLTIKYKPSGGTWSNMTTLKTDENSQYSYSWTPPAVGTFQVKASWEGDADTLPAESDATTVTVNKAASTISITVSKTSITLGSSITISGVISPVRAQVTVTIQYKPSGGTWTTLTTPTTDSSGQYSYNWTPTTVGTHELKASWPGDASTLQAESDATTLAVKAPPVASFSHTPSAPIVGDAVAFTSTSTDPDGSIHSWNWDFGDGTSGNGEIVTHTYATAGDFTVKLTVTDNDGLTNTKSITITVSEAPTGISIYLIAAVGAIVIIVIGIAAYSLIRKKP